MIGPSRAEVRDNAARSSPDHVISDVVAIPMDLMLLHKNAVLVVDIMFVKNVAFLITISRGIKFITVKYLKSHSAKQLSHSLKNVINLYGGQ